MLLFGPVGGFEFVKLAAGRRLEFQRPEAGGRLICTLHGWNVENAIAKAMNAIFIDFKKDLLGQTDSG